MLGWGWIHVGVFLALSTRCCEATDNHAAFSNASTSTTSSTSPVSSLARLATTTSNSRALITSCVPGNAIIDPYYFLAPSLRSLPQAEKDLLALSVLMKYAPFIETLGNIIAGPPITNTAAAVKLYNEYFSILQNDVTTLFGPAGTAILLFQNLVTDPCLYSTCFDQFFDQSSSFELENPGGTFLYQASAPCCDRCHVLANGVELEYWPTPAAEPPVSTLVDEANNLTFVSPSVYARYTSLRATDLCGPVGGTFAFTRIPFDPADLSTSYFLAASEYLSLAPPLGSWTRINYADFDSPKCSCTTSCFYDPVNNRTLTNLCTPQISIPPEVTAIDPAWGTCRPDLFGFFDPPIALPRANGLTAPKTTPAEPTPPGPTTPPTPTVPSPVDSPTPPIVTPTPGPEPEPETTPPPAQEPSPSGPVDPLPGTTIPSGGTTVPAGPPIDPTTAPGEPSQPMIGPSVPAAPIASTITIDGSTSPLLSAITAGPSSITINGEVVSANSDSNFVIGTQTLTPGGPAITVSGTVISLAPGATELVVGGSTTELGSIIASYVGITGTPSGTGAVEGTSTGPAPVEFTGGSGRRFVSMRCVGFTFCLAVLMIWL